LVKEGFFIQDSMHFFTGEHLEFLCAVLNSKLFSWLLNLIIGDTVGGNAGNASNVSDLYVPVPTPELESEMKQLLAQEDYQGIDEKVYQIYGLTEAEIACMVGNA